MTDKQKPDDREAYFAFVAENYDRLQPVVVGPAYEAGMAMMVELVPFEGEAAFEFYELGCGTATLTCRLLDQFPKSRGVAIDSEPSMLEIAEQKLAAYGDRAEVRQADITACDPLGCDLIVSAHCFHHVPPGEMPDMLARIAESLRPCGCFILLDHMRLHPTWGSYMLEQRRRIYRRHVSAAIEAGLTTREEIDARWAFKRRMKEEGKDVEYRHTAEGLLEEMHQAGFAEAALAWRVFAHTILVGFAAADQAGHQNA